MAQTEKQPPPFHWEIALGPNRFQLHSTHPEPLVHGESPPLRGQRGTHHRPLSTFRLQTSCCLLISLMKVNKWNSFLQYQGQMTRVFLPDTHYLCTPASLQFFKCLMDNPGIKGFENLANASCI